jgi:hypothetical protein
MRAHHQKPALKIPEPLDADWLRQLLCLDAGADDVGLVEVDRPALAGERRHIERAFPQPRSRHKTEPLCPLNKTSGAPKRS